MKFLAVILSLYFLALNFVPCEDTHLDIDDIQIEISQNVDSNHDHDGSDQCSPLCECQCCHVHVIGFDLLQFRTHLGHIPTKIFSQDNDIIKDVVFPILQPPQQIG